MEIQQLRKALRYVIFIPLGVFLLYSAYYAISVPLEYTDCGLIKSKSTDEVAIKHGVSTKLYLNIQFDKKGFYSQEVQPTTYFKYNVGDRICFDMPKPKTGYNRKLYLIGCLTIYIIFCGSIVIIVIFLIWVLGGDIF